jgi:hypothetical protein
VIRTIVPVALDASQHMDLYDTEPYISQAAQAAADFLHRKLRHPGELAAGR